MPNIAATLCAEAGGSNQSDAAGLISQRRAPDTPVFGCPLGPSLTHTTHPRAAARFIGIWPFASSGLRVVSPIVRPRL